MKHLNHAYIYEDGHSVEVWEQSIRKLTLRYVIIREAYVHSAPEGRLIFGTYDIALYRALKGCRLQARTPALTHGSLNTQKRHIAIGYLKWTLPSGEQASIYEIEGLSGPYTYQPTVEERFADVKEGVRWGTDPIETIIYAK